MSDQPAVGLPSGHLTMRLAHRAMLRDLGRIAATATALASSPDPERAGALTDYADRILQIIEHHHEGEDEFFWPMLRERGGVNGVLAFGCFHVWGGEGQDTGEPNDVFPDHDVFDPGSDSWMALDPLPTPVHGVTGAAFVNGLIYMPGGGIQQGGSSGSRIFQVYRPAVRCD